MSVGQVTLRGGASISVLPDALQAYLCRVEAMVGLLRGQVLASLLRLDSTPALLPAGLADPAGAAAVIERSAYATALVAAVLVSCAALSGELRCAIAGYRELEHLDIWAAPALGALGRLPAALGAARRLDLQGVVTADPELAAVAVQELGILTVGPAAMAAGDPVPPIAGALAVPYPDGAPRVTRRPDLPTGDARGAPRSVADLLGQVALREVWDDGGGAIDVRILDGPSGRHVIVDITGTSIWNVNPMTRTRQATDFGTNLRSLAGLPSVMSRGVQSALRQAGVGPTDPILLVGHSQGGMVAAQLADELTRSGQFQVRQLVTAGSPIAGTRVPDSVSVLSLENRGDPVPELDGADNPARRSWLTARVDRGGTSVLQRHAITSYVAGAEDLDAIRGPGTDSWHSDLRPFLDARSIRTQVFQVQRD